MSFGIALSDLEYGPQEEEAVLEVLRSRWLTMGERTARFEAEFADFVGVEHAVAVANCSAGLHLALLSLGVGRGDEVILPALTFIATLNAVRYTGATAVLADITSPSDLTLSAENVRAKLTPRTKAVIVMHYGGYPCDMDALRDLAREHGFAVVEDAAHAPGAEYKGVRAGALGDVAAFSFFSNKNLATGEGGMITTSRADLAESLRLLRSHGMTRQTLDRHKGHAFSYDVVSLGYNYRLTEIEAALGSVQLAKLESHNAARERLVRHYQESLCGLPGLLVPFLGYGEPGKWPFEARSAYHLMVVLLPLEADRTHVMRTLRQEGIQTSVHYPLLHGFSDVRRALARGKVRAEGLQVVEEVAPRLLTLPLSPSYGPEVAEQVVEALHRAVR